MTKIQFPYEETNPYWDGKEHEIQPESLFCINGSQYYFMNAFDQSFGFPMMTALKKIEEHFEKVPLDNYEAFTEMLYSVDLKSVPTTLLGEKIGLQPLMKVENLAEELGINKTR